MNTLTNGTIGVLGASLAFWAGLNHASTRQASDPQEVRASRFVVIGPDGAEVAILEATKHSLEPIRDGARLVLKASESSAELKTSGLGADLVLKSGGSVAVQHASTATAWSYLAFAASGSSDQGLVASSNHVFSQAARPGAWVAMEDSFNKRRARIGSMDQSVSMILMSKDYQAAFSVYDESYRTVQGKKLPTTEVTDPVTRPPTILGLTNER